MYYSANTADGKTHCVGAATSSNPEGPYHPEAGTIACPRSQGGAIDPAGFADKDGKLYVTYKIDGNSLGHGGNCNNGIPPLVSTPIMLQHLHRDGITPSGAPKQILDRSDADGPLVEAPSLARVDGTYVLFFSSNCYDGPFYDVSYATASNVYGPYTKSSAPLLVTGDGPNGELYGPGGADVTPDGERIVFHADLGKSANTRQMYTALIEVKGTTVTIK
jgi:beta-xylosidase